MPLRPLLIVLLLAQTADADGPDFASEVSPILTRHCLLCHGNDPSSRAAGLRLDNPDDAYSDRGGRGAAIVPGDPDASLAMQRILSPDESFRMPPSNHAMRLDPGDVDTLRRWIEAGAEYEAPWAWQPMAKVEPPASDDPRWNGHPIDRFIAAGHARYGLVPAERADRRTLIRRLSFDLLGLPPAPAEVEAFVNDEAPGAWERVVDRMLASPHFGERWGRHWLDLMRYAETFGHEFDYPIHHAWRYRDYVVRALNADVPYDLFVTEHLAGDLLDAPRRHPDLGYNESIIGTGWWHLSQGTHAPVDVRLDEAERIDNQIDVLSKTFLGITVACARCHDHKFDAISAKDYYALAGFVQSSRRDVAYLDPNGSILTRVNELRAAHRGLEQKLSIAPDTYGDEPISKWLLASREVETLRASDEPALYADQLVFADFESGTYDGWTATGTAFGETPRRVDDIAGHQGDLEAVGDGLVNTHQTRGGEDVHGADRHTGTLTSDSFEIAKPWIHFRIGGGRHDGRTGLHLVIDDTVVRKATGHNDNRMRWERFDVNEFVGRDAHFVIVDEVTGGWGNIGIDHIVFSPHADPNGSIELASQMVAARNDLDAALLRRWVDALRAPNLDRLEHPMHAWRVASKGETTPSDDEAATRFRDLGARLAQHEPRAEGTFESFDGRSRITWRPTGHAFDDSGHARVRVDGNTVVPVGGDVVQSGVLAAPLHGTLRSDTFEIGTRFIHYRVAGHGCRVRIIIDGYHLNEFNALLFEGLLTDVNSPDHGWQWVTHRLDLYHGHRAYIEIIDDGGGWIAVDEIVFSDHGAPQIAKTVAHAVTENARARDLRGVARTFDRQLQSALTRWGARNDSVAGVDLLSWLAKHDLIELPLDEGDVSRVSRLLGDVPQPIRVLAMTDGTPEDERIFIRGNHRELGEVAPRSFIDSLAERQRPIRHGSGRLELAERFVDPDNPLTSRVMVNRVWHHLFGRGIVATTDDFGGLGETPSHPELLDWLARWYPRRADWSTKQLIRLIVTSETYRMASDLTNAANEAVDPTNVQLHRGNLRRLQGEAIRDALLAISGRLDRTMYGAPVPIHLTPFMTGRGRPGNSGPLDGNGRRSIYIAVRRNFLSPMMLAFDTPVPFSSIGRRNVSNVPAQALILMNDPLVIEQTRTWAARVLEDVDADAGARIDAMYRAAYARPPNEDELEAAVAFIGDRNDDVAVWAELAHVLVNVKEFIFLR